jgi:hypothetical protein
VTLVELLVTITILAILGSAILFASFNANRAARVAATRSMVASLHSLVSDKYDEFRTRRVNAQIHHNNWQEEQRRRVAAMWELIRLEVPDRWSDVTLSPIDADPASTQVKNPRFQQRTPLANAYLRKFQQIARAENKRTNKQNTGEQVTDNQGAECLYMLVTLGTADGEALSLFRQSDIGDVDGDGAPEFLDGWERPVNFIRWAPGFTRDQNGVRISALQSGDPEADHDPVDAYRVYANAYRLVPLIYSAGPDGEFGIRLLKPVVTGQLTPHEAYQDPADGQAVLLGAPTPDADQTWQDNIHNHELDVRG